jgi:pyruvate dehydrogenase E2 component (dihydrolipoamide acetyltransferase)
MATPVEMPKLGNTVEECILAKWRKNQGDAVSAGEIIADIETDKATFELAAPAAGTLLELFFGEGALVPVYTNVCVIGQPGEEAGGFRPAQAAPPISQKAVDTPAAPAAGGGEPLVSAPAPGAAGGFLSPRARKFAREHGLLPPVIVGSGPGGRILEQDLRNLYQSSHKISSLAKKQIEAGYEARREGSGLHGMIVARDLDEPPVRMAKIRETIGRRMRESLAGSAQYTMHTSADSTGLLSLRSKIKAALQTGAAPDVNIGDMVMFAAVKALIEMPEVNAELIDGKLYRRAGIHMGFACDTEKGLLVPVVRNCEKLSLAELSARVKELAKRAVAGGIGADDLTGGTFTISNLGNLGIQSFTPILNPPQVAILGVDAIELKAVRREGRVEFVDHIGLSLTCDHQVIDGAPGARFLKVVRERIENIESFAGLDL